jgi:integrase
MMFAYRAGTRPSESFAFYWEDIDFKNAKITINRQVQWDECKKVWCFSNPKYDSFRTIEIDDEFVSLLAREKIRQERARIYYAEHFINLYENENMEVNSLGEGLEIHPVCIRENGEFISPRNMQHTASIIHHEMVFPTFDMHSFRKTHGTMLAEKDVPPKYLQHRLGHKNIRVTLQYYIEKTDGMVKQGVAILSNLFKPYACGLTEDMYFDVDVQDVLSYNFFDIDVGSLTEPAYFDVF